MNKYDLTFGESVAVRQRFLEVADKKPLVLDEAFLTNLGYASPDLDQKLLDITKKVISRQFGISYKHVMLSHGAAGGVVLALRALKERGHKTAYTAPPPYFSYYPLMIKAAGLRHFAGNLDINLVVNPVHLVDSPSNPMGRIASPTRLSLGVPVVWDAPYHNNVYTDGKNTTIQHEVLVGSFSKLTGVNGLRLGWIATNDPLLFDRMSLLATAEYCGLSALNKHLLVTLLTGLDWEKFETLSRASLNANREEWSKLERFFDGPVSPNGMFYYSFLDAACKRLLTKSGIEWLPGTNCGTDDDYGRFNLGQDVKLIKNAVKDVLKNDRI